MGKVTGFLEIDRQDRRYAPASDRIRHFREFVTCYTLDFDGISSNLIVENPQADAANRGNDGNSEIPHDGVNGVGNIEMIKRFA